MSNFEELVVVLTDRISKWCVSNLLPVQSVISTFLEKKLLRMEQPYLRSYMARIQTKMQTNRELSSQSPAITRFAWCEKGDSNPHTFRHKILNLACLPVPPLSQLCQDNILQVQNRFCPIMNISWRYDFVCLIHTSFPLFLHQGFPTLNNNMLFSLV